IVDRFLEHSRVYWFHNGGDDKFFISSADWMERSFDRRIEVAAPIFDRHLQQELRRYLEIQLSDTSRARSLAGSQQNDYRKGPNELRAQDAIPIQFGAKH
ncbi:polyphosphate kinase 1, partial [bacterium]|nr:polyphosphate kinase 1 [bacterium]